MNPLLILPVGFLTAAAVCSQPATDDAVPAHEIGAEALREMRRAAAERPRRIIYNNDGNDAFKPFESTAGFLARRSTGLESTQVDTIFYCTGWPFRYSHRSAIAEPFADWISSLHDKNEDPLLYMADFAKRNQREIFWSIRVNDIHDSFGPYTKLISDWKLQNRHLLMAPGRTVFPYGRAWTALDFSKQGVRDHMLSIIEEVCTNYPIDGIELDFNRHDIFFKNNMFGLPASAENIGQMTGWMRRIREMTERAGRQRGRPILIAARTADSVGYCMETGIDLVSWFEEQLLDLWIPGGFFQLEPWEQSVALAHSHGIRIHPCLSQTRLPQANAAAWRAEAARALRAGADGIYVFNFWECRFDQHALLSELGSLEMLDRLPQQEDFLTDLDIPISATRKFTPAQNIAAALSFIRATPQRFLSPECLWRCYPHMAGGKRLRVPQDHPTLVAALAAADDGDHIWLRSDHEETAHELMISKSVTVHSCDAAYQRPEKGARLEVPAGSHGIRLTAADLSLNGLVIAMRDGAADHALILSGGTISLGDCSVLDAPAGGSRHALMAAARWNGRDEVRFDRVVFQQTSPHGTLLQPDPQAPASRKFHVHFRNCLIEAATRQTVLNSGKSGFWTLEHCTIVNPNPCTLAAGGRGSMRPPQAPPHSRQAIHSSTPAIT
jgi:hypothetical protein